MDAERTSHLRLTSAGWTTVATAALFAIAGRAAGIEEFVGVAVIALATLAAAGLITFVSGRSLSVTRSVSSSRVAVGDPLYSEVTVGSSRRRRLAVRLPVHLVADLDDRSPQRQTVSSSATERTVRFRVHTGQRGPLRLGPLRASLADPLGLVAYSVAIHDLITVLVVPHIVDLSAGWTRAGGGGSGGGVPHRSTLVSDEFDSMRDYVPGDDIRLMHWPSTARLGVPVVRVMEPLTLRRTTVLLHRAGPETDRDAFERAVIATGSVIASLLAAGEAVRFLIDGATVDDAVLHRDDLDAVLDRLAVVSCVEESSPLAPRRAEPGEHAARLVVCCARVDDALRELCAVESAAGSEIIVVDAAATRHDGSDADGAALRPAVPAVAAVRFGPDDRLDQSWAAMERER
ncbi:MAG: DUF58 domain-containing protein [Actinobacteria bacterium]|nr:DUF58 domain-containing protein [Actinomycetota bacterium]